jgi:hypothetical protein
VSGDINFTGNLRKNGMTPSWTDLTLGNGWINYDATNYNKASYYKDHVTNRVYLRGLIKSGTLSTNICTLGTGHRPYQPGGGQLIVGVPTSTGSAGSYQIGDLRIFPLGAIQLITGLNGWVSLDNISFLADGL